MLDVNNLINFNIANVILTNNDVDNQSETVFYKPNIFKENLTEYSSIIKFIPFYKNPEKSLFHKWEVFLENPNTGLKRYIDDYSTLNDKKNYPSIFSAAFFALRDSDSIVEKELANKFKRIKKYYSLIQVIKDKHHPELEGKILIFKFGEQIYEKLKLMAEGDGEFKLGHNFYDLIEGGKLFNLKIKKVGENPRYTESEFLDKKYTIMINGEEFKIKNKNKDLEVIYEFLKENSPDLSKYEFKHWDKETITFVREAIFATIPSGKTLNKLIKLFPDILYSEMENESKNENENKKSKILDEINEEINNEIKNNSKNNIDDDIDDDINNTIDDDIDYDDIDDEDEKIIEKNNKKLKNKNKKIKEEKEEDDEDEDIFDDFKLNLDDEDDDDYNF